MQVNLYYYQKNISKSKTFTIHVKRNLRMNIAYQDTETIRKTHVFLLNTKKKREHQNVNLTILLLQSLG